MRVRVLRVLTLGVMLALVGPLAQPAGAITIGEGEGCTPGFWKNHLGAWEEYSPSDLLSESFTLPAGYEHLGDATMLQALKWSGGPTLEDAMKNLLKHAVTAFLNAAHDDLEYPYRRFGNPYNIQATVNAALASLNRAQIVQVKNELDEVNNGDCTTRKSDNTTGGK